MKTKPSMTTAEAGRRGGLVGGQAKVATKGFGSLTAEERSKRSKAAAKKRWAAVRAKAVKD